MELPQDSLVSPDDLYERLERSVPAVVQRVVECAMESLVELAFAYSVRFHTHLRNTLRSEYRCFEGVSGYLADCGWPGASVAELCCCSLSRCS